MPPSADPVLEDDASGEAWFQKGVTLLEGRKQEREIEEKLLRSMHRQTLQEGHTWLALFVGLMAIFQAHLGAAPWLTGLTALSSVIMLIGAIDSASAKRTRAVLAWMEYRQQKDKAARREED